MLEIQVSGSLWEGGSEMLEIQICESLDGGIKQILLDGKPVQQHIRRVCLIFEKSCRPMVTLEPCADWDFTKAGLDIGTRYEAKLRIVPQAEGDLTIPWMS